MSTATKQDISRWFDTGVSLSASHMIIMFDTFDWNDFPVYVSVEENAYDKAHGREGKNMEILMEVYDLNMDKEEQLSERRAFHY
jgi:hypothetical protein